MLHRWVRTSFKVRPRYARTSFEVCTSTGVCTSIGPRPRPAYMGARLPGSHRIWSLWVPKHWEWIPSLMFLAATKQLYKWYFPSVCPSVRPSVTPFWLCSPHRIIMKFSGVITNDKSKVHAKGQGQRSKVKVTEVTTQLNRFRTVTPVWILIWWCNDAYSLMLLRRGALLFFKVIRQISRSHGSKNRQIWPRLGVSGL